MDLGLTGKIAVVAAASRGLGKAAALELSREGAKVAILSRNEQRIQDARNQIADETGNAVQSFVGDVTDHDQMRRIIRLVEESWGTIHILVCNAGGPPAGLAEDLTLDQYEHALRLNLLSTVLLSYAVIPLMKEQRWGRIINITSVSAKQPIDTLTLSNTARAGVLGFAKSLSNQLAPFGITVNSVCPGYTRTERVEELAQSFAQSGKGSVDDFFRTIEKAIPMGRFGRPEELAKAIAFLASEGAAYITGAALQVDGGYIKALY